MPSPPQPPGRGRSLARKTADAVARSITDVLQNEELAARRGLLQRLDPRVKLVTLVLFAVVASLVHSIWTLLALVAVTVVLAALSRVPVPSFIRKVWLSAGLLAFFIAMPSALSWFTPGAVAFQIGPFTFTEPGLLGVATLVTRVAAGRRVRPPHHLDHALVGPAARPHRPALPGRRRRHAGHDAAADPDAAAHRGADPPRAREPYAHPRHRARTATGSTERMAFVVRKSMKTADDVYDAMLARGYTGAMPSLRRLRAGPARLAVAGGEHRRVRARARRGTGGGVTTTPRSVPAP